MAVLGRIMMLIVGYLLACAAAALVLTIGTLTQQSDDLLQLGVQTATIGPVVGIGAVVIAGVAMLPALLAIAITEGFALRSSILYGAVGGVLALSLSYGIDFAGYVGESDAGVAHERQVLAAAGIAGGFVYWLFAGRKAGSWRR